MMRLRFSGKNRGRIETRGLSLSPRLKQGRDAGNEVATRNLLFICTSLITISVRRDLILFTEFCYMPGDVHLCRCSLLRLLPQTLCGSILTPSSLLRLFCFHVGCVRRARWPAAARAERGKHGTGDSRAKQTPWNRSLGNGKHWSNPFTGKWDLRKLFLRWGPHSWLSLFEPILFILLAVDAQVSK